MSRGEEVEEWEWVVLSHLSTEWKVPEAKRKTRRTKLSFIVVRESNNSRWWESALWVAYANWTISNLHVNFYLIVFIVGYRWWWCLVSVPTRAGDKNTIGRMCNTKGRRRLLRIITIMVRLILWFYSGKPRLLLRCLKERRKGKETAGVGWWFCI